MSSMDAKGILIALISLCLVAMSTSAFGAHIANSVERTVGVDVGDWVKYGDFLAVWESNDPTNQDPPQDLVDHNNTEWVTNTVKNISGTEITFQTVTHFKNGTETTNISYVDINTGDGNGTFAFISADLDPDEKIYDSTSYYQTWINQTFDLVYANAIREVNHLAAESTQLVLDEWGENVVETDAYSTQYFWDKTTGAMLQRWAKFVATTEEYTVTTIRSETIVETNLWEENPDTTPPTAEAGPDKTATVGQTLSFDAESSLDNEGGWGLASFEWDFGDGTQATGMSTEHAFDEPGTYTVTLTVKDWADNSDEDTLTVTVQESTSPLSTEGLATLTLALIAGLLLCAGAIYKMRK